MEVMWCVWEEGSNVTEYMLAAKPKKDKAKPEKARVIPNEELIAA
jgi:hypothetical protein